MSHGDCFVFLWKTKLFIFIMNEDQKLPKSVSNIPGTIVDSQYSQLLISSGIPSLDQLLGGGFPIGTLILIEEDECGSYAKVITKYFLAEGAVSQHSMFVASQDISTESLIRDLPAVIEVDPEPVKPSPASSEKMKIAFRYHYLPTSEKLRGLEFGHHFDLSKTISPSVLVNSDISHWKLKDNFEAPGTFCNPAYHNLLQSIHNKIKEGHFSINDTSKKRSVLRIALKAIGSPMWLGDINLSAGALPESRDLNMFIYCLRALVRSAFAVAVITIPSHLIEKECIERCIYSSDIAFKLQSFSGTHLENNPVLSEYHGYFHIIKFASINSLLSKHPGSVEYIFKLMRKKFYIEKLYLPPDLQAIEENRVPSMGCGSSDKHLLDF